MVTKVEEKVYQGTTLTRTPKKILEKEDFIKLFITQLQYQDPMNPIENHEMAMQLALFNQVDQLFSLNDSVKDIKNLIQSFSFGMVSFLVDKKVKLESNLGRVENGNFLGGEFFLKEPANKVLIIIKNKTGKVIKTIELNGVPKGNHKIEWDATDQMGNKVSDGNYYFSIQILDGNGRVTTDLTPIMTGKVTGAQFGEELKLVINEELTVNLNQIKEVIGG